MEPGRRDVLAQPRQHVQRVEKIFGWLKTIGLMRKTRHRGSARVGWMFMLTLATQNILRMRNLLASTA